MLLFVRLLTFTTQVLPLLNKSIIMTHVQALIDPNTIKGTGNNLCALIQVDQDDSEDATIELWRAYNQDHLYNQVAEDL